jgi:hypothetical protein
LKPECFLVVNGIATLVAQVQTDWSAKRRREMLGRQLRLLGYRPAAESA